MINKIIRNFLAKQAAGRSDDGIMITLRDPQKIEMLENIMADLLMRNGFNPADITSERQLKNILNQIDAIQKQSTTTSGIRNVESAKVFDLEGNKLDPNKPIIGGKQEGMFDNIFNRMQNEMKGLRTVDDQPPPGSRGGDDDIAAPVQSAEESLRDMTEAEIKANIEAQNKSAIENILKRKNREDVYGIDDYDTTNMSEIKKEIIRTETKLGNLNPDSPDFREKAKPLVDKIEALKNKMREDKAYGGRVGFASGAGFKFLQKVFGKEKFKEMATRDPEMYQGLLEVVDMYRKRDKEGLKMYLQKFLPHMDDEAIEDFIRGSDGTEGLVGELIRLGSGRDYKGKLEMIKKSEEMKKLRDLEVTEDMLRKPNADGGIMRLGFKDGMNRRTFLKLLGGAMAIPIVGKILKPFKIGKKVTKVPIIKTDDVAGKPEWFDQLVNKVIIEGDEVTKRFATKDREIVHMKKIDDDNTVMVYQDLDEGAVRVDYDAPSNMGEDTVSLQYKKPNPDEGDPRPKAEFEASELEPRYVGGPEDADIEFDGLGGGSSIKMLESDVSKLKEYATGQKPTMKEFIESKKRKDRVDAINRDQLEQAEYISGKYGDGPEPPDDIDFEDFASGGIAKMLGE